MDVHQGSIAVESSSDEGTTFALTFPSEPRA
jgi:signal transduction histidine kinase